MKQYDVVVIGSGPGGYVAAIRSAQLGLTVCCIEKGALGGTCLNVGCIPSKSLLSASEFYAKIHLHSQDFGIHVKDCSYNFSEMMARKEKTILGFTKGIEGLFKKNKIDWLQGAARLNSPKEVVVGSETIQAKHVILATGSTPIPLQFLPFDEERVLSSTGALGLKKVPKKLLVIGAGVIGVELGSVYQRLGTQVTFIEFLDRICPAFDTHLSKALQKSLSASGMEFHFSSKVIRADVQQEITLFVEGQGGISSFSADAVLVAVGRRPFTEGLGLEELGIQKDAKGFITIDGSFRTTIPNIFAIGDLVDGPMLAHKASEEGIVVAELIAGKHPVLDYFSIPNVIYTYPEVASVGLTEEEIKSRSLKYKVAISSFKANSRARCVGEEEGFVKMLAEEKSRRILGVHIFGAKASEMIGEAVVAIAKRLTADELGSLSHAHPTLSESIKEAALSLFQGAIH